MDNNIHNINKEVCPACDGYEEATQSCRILALNWELCEGDYFRIKKELKEDDKWDSNYIVQQKYLKSKK